MTRGNQREVAREKNLKKTKTAKKTKDELPVEKKKARDSAALQEKQKKPVDASGSPGPAKETKAGAPKKTARPK